MTTPMLEIRDQGIGIPAEDIPKLFSKFQRIDNSSRRKIGGTGLGLAICRDILAGLDATITVDPTAAGCGASFRVVFPCPA